MADTLSASQIEALTMLYLQSRDLSDVTPAKLAELYHEVKAEIKESLPPRRISSVDL